jgi:medium-chain acyl-[acyl-carrier-protein] hydrolase
MSARPPKWLVCWPRSSRPRARLICIGHAGAGAAPFRAWAEVVPEDVEVCAVRLPGRESRLREPAFDDVETLLAAALPALADDLTPPFALFGHCSGALVAFELARALRRSARPSPFLLAVSGRAPPAAQAGPGPELDLRERLETLGGTSHEIFESPVLFEAFRPTLLADFRLDDDYRYRPEPPLDVPIVVFAGADDPRTGEAAGWAAETSASFDVVPVPGDRLFRGAAWTELGRRVGAEVGRLAVPVPG